MWKIRLLYLFLILLMVGSIVLFPTMAESPYTFAQLQMHPEETMKKYENDWNQTQILYRNQLPKEPVLGEQVATITIPKMGLYEIAVYYGAEDINNNWQITTPGHLGNWDIFGQAGVTCVGAHNYQLFKNLHLLEAGDKILVETEIDRYVYVVDGTAIYHHEEDDWNSIATNHKAPYAMNLMTCYPFDQVETNDMYIVYTTMVKGTRLEK